MRIEWIKWRLNRIDWHVIIHIFCLYFRYIYIQYVLFYDLIYFVVIFLCRKHRVYQQVGLWGSGKRFPAGPQVCLKIGYRRLPQKCGHRALSAGASHFIIGFNQPSCWNCEHFPGFMRFNILISLSETSQNPATPPHFEVHCSQLLYAFWQDCNSSTDVGNFSWHCASLISVSYRAAQVCQTNCHWSIFSTDHAICISTILVLAVSPSVWRSMLEAREDLVT